MLRMIQNPSTLVAAVMKEKYYKNGDLLEAKLGPRPSLIWKSLFSYLELIRLGMAWKVGNGKKNKDMA